MAYIKGRSSGTFFKGFVAEGPQAAHQLAKLGKAVRDELLKEATLDGADVLLEAMRARVPEGPGQAHTREALHANSRAGRVGATAYVGLKDVPAASGEAQPHEYFEALEFGEGGRAARPFARPGFDASSGQAVDKMGEKVKELIRRATGVAI